MTVSKRNGFTGSSSRRGYSLVLKNLKDLKDDGTGTGAGKGGGLGYPLKVTKIDYKGDEV